MIFLYRDMDRTALDAGYNNTQAIADFPGTMNRFRVLSKACYDATSCLHDIPYGPRPRQRFDWLSCGKKDAPVFIFIHGGYWQNCTKEDFAFVANGPLQRGFDVVLAEYTLAPDASMTQIVAEIGALLDHLACGTHRFSVSGRRVCLSGHSAGGHLTALHRTHPAVTHAMPISALVDLEPISLSWLNDKLQLTPREIEDYSPLRHIGAGVPMTITVGAAELPELVRHSKEYAQACRAANQIVDYIAVPACTHFSVLEDLSSTSGVQMTALMQQMAL